MRSSTARPTWTPCACHALSVSTSSLIGRPMLRPTGRAVLDRGRPSAMVTGAADEHAPLMDWAMALALWLHALGLIIAVGYYGVLGLVLIPALEKSVHGTDLAESAGRHRAPRAAARARLDRAFHRQRHCICSSRIRRTSDLGHCTRQLVVGPDAAQARRHRRAWCAPASASTGFRATWSSPRTRSGAAQGHPPRAPERAMAAGLGALAILLTALAQASQ